MKLIYILGLVLVLVVTGCATQTQAPMIPANNSPVQNNNVLFSSSQYAPYAHLISGATLDAAAVNVTSDFDIKKTVNSDGTTTIVLSSTNPEYSTQTYTLQSGEQLYFIERNLGDDSNIDANLGDDMAIKVDAQGYIVQ